MSMIKWFVRLEGPRRSAIDAIRDAASRSEQNFTTLQDAWIEAYVGSFVPFEDEENADGSGDVPCACAWDAAALCSAADENDSLDYSICLSVQGEVGAWAYLRSEAVQGGDPLIHFESRIDRVAVAGAIGIAARTAHNALGAALNAICDGNRQPQEDA